jgi:hypothetical protein
MTVICSGSDDVVVVYIRPIKALLFCPPFRCQTPGPRAGSGLASTFCCDISLCDVPQ